MKHVAAQADMIVGMQNARTLLQERRVWGEGSRPVGLPTPGAAKSRLGQTGTASQRNGVAGSWLRPEPEHFAENLMMSALAVAAVAGVGYGLNLVISLVEHWAVFQIGVAKTLQ